MLSNGAAGQPKPFILPPTLTIFLTFLHDYIFKVLRVFQQKLQLLVLLFFLLRLSFLLGLDVLRALSFGGDFFETFSVNFSFLACYRLQMLVCLRECGCNSSIVWIYLSGDLQISLGVLVVFLPKINLGSVVQTFDVSWLDF